MRQGQQNRRGRGRGRKAQNPLSRNYESNGPDVKIRGNAAHIAEKYSALARDALAAGDTITAENFLQHAEHYNRIIMAAQAQQSAGAQPSESANGSGGGRQQGDGAGDGPAAQREETANGSEAEVHAGAGKANGKSKKESKAESGDDAQPSDEASSDNAAA
jgi:hypothetical protein